jgi:hypothetical protein
MVVEIEVKLWSTYPLWGSNTLHVNYPALDNRADALMCEDGASDFTGERLIEVLRPLVGLTSPPSAVSLVPNERSLNPSALIFCAAFTSLSW